MLIQQGIHWFVLHLDPHPHFGGSTVLDELLVQVPSAVEPGSRKSLIEVGHGVNNIQILDLVECSDWSADGFAWLPI